MEGVGLYYMLKESDQRFRSKLAVVSGSASLVKDIGHNKVFQKICQLIVSSGNFLNAGNKDKAQADGFDIIDMLSKNQWPQSRIEKGQNDSISLLQYLRDNELKEDEREICTSLADRLKACKHPTADAACFADLSQEYQSKLVKLVEAVQLQIETAIRARQKDGAETSVHEVATFQKYLQVIKIEKCRIEATKAELDDLGMTLKDIKCLFGGYSLDKKVNALPDMSSLGPALADFAESLSGRSAKADDIVKKRRDSKIAANKVVENLRSFKADRSDDSDIEPF